MRKNFRIATRESALALAQAEAVRNALAASQPQLQFELLTLKTSGDAHLDIPLAKLGRAPEIGGKGLFTKEIEAALLDGSADFAVHSMKDLPVEHHPALIVAAVPSREDPADCLVSKYPGGWRALPENAVVATGSPRRKAQLSVLRPDLLVREIRGNVPTRLNKVSEDNDLAATILARAGLARLGLINPAKEAPWVIEPHDGKATLFVTKFLPTEMLPAPGQGAIAIQCRADDNVAFSLATPLHDARSEITSSLERELLAALGGGCHMALGAQAELGENGQICLSAFLYDGAHSKRDVLEWIDTEPKSDFVLRLATNLRNTKGSADV